MSIVNKLKEQKLWVYTLVFPLYFICFYTVEYFIRSDYYPVHLPLDDIIPFCQWFAVPYVLWLPMLLAAALYLLYNDTAGYKLYMVFVGISFMTTLLIYVLFPNGQDLRPVYFENPDLMTRFVQYLYSCDSNTNVCPSLHVIGSFAAVFGVFHDKKLSGAVKKTAIAGLCALIALSTVFIKQHSVADIIAAAALSAVVWVIVYAKFSPVRKRIEGVSK